MSTSETVPESSEDQVQCSVQNLLSSTLFHIGQSHYSRTGALAYMTLFWVIQNVHTKREREREPFKRKVLKLVSEIVMPGRTQVSGTTDMFVYERQKGSRETYLETLLS